MFLLAIKLAQSPVLFVQLFDRMKEGGMFFMFPVMIMFLLVLFLIIKSVLKIIKGQTELAKNIQLLNSIGLLSAVWGMLGQLIGIVGMFDKVEEIGNISTAVFAGGLKISALPPIFGLSVFVISRVASIVFTWVQKEE